MFAQQVILERYRVISKAGRGGYGVVYHAYDNVLKRDVAIKSIQLSEADVARARQAANENAAVGPDSILPALPDLGAPAEDGLPHDPSFLDKRDRRRESARMKGRRSGRGEAASSPAASAKAARAWGGATTSDIAALAGSLPGIDGAGQVAIGGVGGAVALSEDALEPLRERELPADAGAAHLDILDGSNMTVMHASPVKAPARSAKAARTAGAGAGANAAGGLRASDAAFYDNIPGLEEARAAAHLNDPNIVTVYDCVVEGSTVYVIMEYVEGKTLARIMQELQDNITLDMVTSVFDGVSHALEVAHDANMLHLDIKPENVIVNKNGQVKVADFGLATLMDASGHGTAGGGTIGYMPLEQMQQRALDVRTDEWALASLTYEMLSGTNPFHAKTLAEAQAAITNAELVLPSQCWQQIDPAMDDIMFQALDPDPDERFPSVKKFQKSLSPLLGSAADGKKQLAQVVAGTMGGEGTESVHLDAAPHTALPLVDRLGPRGSAILMRVFAAAASAMVGAIALLNIRFGADEAWGLFTSSPIAFWIILAALVGVTAWKPRFGMPAAFAAFFVMLCFNQAWILGIVLLIVTGAWWWFFGRKNDGACTCVLLQPLFGSFGFAAVAPIAAGVMLDVREAVASAAMAAVSAIAFATLGSGALAMWDIAANAQTLASPDLAGQAINQVLLFTLADANTWCVAVSWVVAAGVYSFFCSRGKKALDIVGACVAAAVVIVGGILDTLLLNSGVMLFSLVGGIVAGIVGIILALMNVPDRIRSEAWMQ